MGVSVFPSSKPAVPVAFSVAGLGGAFEIWRGLKKAIFAPYRPELHYMHGPGPKCVKSMPQWEGMIASYTQCNHRTGNDFMGIAPIRLVLSKSANFERLL